MKYRNIIILVDDLDDIVQDILKSPWEEINIELITIQSQSGSLYVHNTQEIFSIKLNYYSFEFNI